MLHQAIKAAQALRAIRKKGKFHGKIQATTPIAFLFSIIVSFGRSEGITSHSI
jgi:hypothetical protein